MKKSRSYWSALVLAAAAAGCTNSSPTRPADVGTSSQASAVTDARTGVTLTTPQPLTPTNGQQLKFADQPLTLTFKNGVTTGSTALTYSVQVANDAGFASIAYSKDGIPETAGQTAGVVAGMLSGAELGSKVIPVAYLGPVVGAVVGAAVGSEVGKRLGRALLAAGSAFVNTLTS